jgi:DNA mismatch endonuclease (patch repair protein)
MRDPLSKAERSVLMGRVRNRGNKSTEQIVEQGLSCTNINGWVKHPKFILGCPDFYFPNLRLAIFVDGCFWHSCPKCGRVPKSRVAFWSAKISDNRRRDSRIRRRLRSSGFHVLRIWEHELRRSLWLTRIERTLARLQGSLRS